MTSLDWNELQAALSALECDVSPAGLHGQLAAIACRSDKWPPELGLDTSASDDQAWATLREYAQQTAKALESAELEFSPLMPGDEQMLWRRLEALAEWAECFAFGLSLNGPFEPKDLSSDAQECLQHLLEVSRLDPDDAEATGAEAEQAFTELVEFLRVAVMTPLCRISDISCQTRKSPPLSLPRVGRLWPKALAKTALPFVLLRPN